MASFSKKPKYKYGVVVASPPWQHPDPTQMTYRPLSTLQISTLPLARLTLPDSVLFLACPPPCLPQALEVLTIWGFSFVTAITQVTPAKPMPPAESKVWLDGWWDKGKMTTVIVAKRGIVKPPSDVLAGVTRFMGGTSDDPLEPFRALGEAVWPGPYIELWAKEERAGWDVWGRGIRESINPLGGNQLDILEDAKIAEGMARIKELWQNHLTGGYEIGDILHALSTGTRKRYSRHALLVLAGSLMTGKADHQTAQRLYRIARMFPANERYRPWKHTTRLYDRIAKERTRRGRFNRETKKHVEEWVNTTFGFTKAPSRLDGGGEQETTDAPESTHEEPSPRPSP